MNVPDKTSAELFAAQALRSQLKKELTENILPYWIKNVCKTEGRICGRIDGNDKADASAPIGGIMTARILWTFSSAYRILKDSVTPTTADSYLKTASAAKNLIIEKFLDKEYGGTFWSINPDGTPLDTKKQIYAIAFAIYGLAEYNRATGDGQALEYAIQLFHAIEDHSYDTSKDGYLEAFTRSWDIIEDMRLSDKDANESKTMNTHLHILEAYTCLYRVWNSPLLKKQLKGLIEIFENRIIGHDGHLILFFDEDWNRKSDIISYGHDIEASWLLHEAALVLGDKDILERIERIVPKIASAAEDGFHPEDGMIYEQIRHDNKEETDRDRHWWVQAETVVGFFNLWNHFASTQGLEKALMCWDFIKSHIIDHENGEWFWSLKADGTINRIDDKAGFWKCPYHNGRMCMEIIERLKQ